MKKLTTIFVAVTIFITANAFAASTDVSTDIKTMFQHDFSSVSEVNWSKNEDVYLVNFKSDSRNMTAAYNEEGKLLCIARFIPSSELPLNVSRALNDRYTGYTIDPSIVEVSDNETSYFINAENDKYKLELRSNASGMLTVVNKTRK